ncbi:hypothetical protein [Streptomyces sp. C10-9-1]|uniref:hypothetical protein n=1 Tax=Streptomyces sp. C10-9-1 TaxID=1859285 RepID=UPI003D737C9B
MPGVIRSCLRRDLAAASVAALLVLVAVLVGHYVQNTQHNLSVRWAPFVATWNPHVGPGTAAAPLVAAAVIAYGPPLADRLPWRGLLPGLWAAAMAWIWSLALIDGWWRGIAVKLTTRYEYLQVIDRFDDIPATLRTFNDHILIGTPDNWPPHIAGHPPGATLTFVLLDRIGLGGGAWAGAFVITAGASAAVAVAVAVRALASERLARRAAPFLALVPGAVWMGTSADAYFAGAACWALALLALAVTRRSLWWASASGLLFGWCLYLSYGFTLLALLGGGVLLLGRRRLRERPLLLVHLVAGLAVAPVAFTLLGFAWWEAYPLLVERYHQGVGGTRPYWYWVWANLALAVVITGLATAPGLRRTGAALLAEPRRALTAPGTGGEDAAAARLAVLVAAGLLAIAAADLSGMSKAETERIWLPFAMWLLPACAFLPRPRGWLAAQAVLALLVNHLLLTSW